ncbi:MAG: helix-turn-helix domain-containing protein, partial [Psychrosphaera sp.]|nr:helix-turn-helix domain-containing protein [Psychrosphaera sp.]
QQRMRNTTMTLTTAYFALLFGGLGFMLAQILVKQKRLEHLFFAIFCGSMAMVAAQQLSADTLGPYQYLFGLGTCATCNAIWLTSKAMFCGEDSITKKHIIFALLISALIIINNSVHMAYELSALTSNTYKLLNNGLGEIINLLSSTVLALTFWAAFNGISNQTKQEFWLRTLFIASFCSAIILCIVFAKAFYAPDMLPLVFPWLMVISALQVMLTTQMILWWKQYRPIEKRTEQQINIQPLESATSNVDQSLICGINSLLNEDKRYLTPNLKMIDLANELNVSEYKISRAIRHHFAAPNFNHFINSLRIEHAKNLLEQQESQNWTILVIALESGFSSLATFNRVFKAQLGYAPNEHRKSAMVHS